LFAGVDGEIALTFESLKKLQHKLFLYDCISIFNPALTIRNTQTRPWRT